MKDETLTQEQKENIVIFEVCEHDFEKWASELQGGCYMNDEAVNHFCEQNNISHKCLLARLYWAFTGGYGCGMELYKKMDEFSQKEHCGTLKEENEKLARRAIEAERGAREIAASVDAIIAQIAIHYGDKAFDPDVPEKQIGYRITVPVIDIKAITEKYEVHAMKNEKDGTYVIAVGLRDDPEKKKAELDDAIRIVCTQATLGGMPQDLVDKFPPEPKY